MSNKVFNIHEYKKNKKVVGELSKVIKILDDVQNKLYPYMHYFTIGYLSNAINQTKETLETHLKVAKRKIKEQR